MVTPYNNYKPESESRLSHSYKTLSIHAGKSWLIMYHNNTITTMSFMRSSSYVSAGCMSDRRELRRTRPGPHSSARSPRAPCSSYPDLLGICYPDNYFQNRKKS